MMRWLKEKKRGEKKFNSPGAGGGGGGSGADDFYQEEDDYGFEKEKQPNKSPTTKRQLPPTPAAPEEKSTHIYEEIPDLHVSCMPEHERTSLLKNKKQGGRSKTTSGNINNINKNNNSNRKSNSGASGVDNSRCLDDAISPYMVVPVDEEVRQTPPHFHRNGTPEVHCDFIVKDTHCEILLTRKPKVGAFRLDSATLTGGDNNNNNNHNSNNININNNGNGGGGGGGASAGIRNNTHFCSLNRRASVDVQPGGEGKGASAFSWSSSAFSSASTSRMNSMGTSSMSLSTLPEHHRHHQVLGQPQPSVLVEGDSGSNGSSAKGVMTYSTASNFIPRSTKLVFKPLTPLDPDFFDAPDQTLAAATMNAELTGQGQNAMLAPSADDTGSIQYAAVQGQAQPTTDSPVVYSAIQNDEFYSSTQGQGQGQCRPASPPNLQEILKCQAMADNIPFRSNLIRPYSPSSSSSCTYASVSFPPESCLYNTIQGLDMAESPPPGSHPLSLLGPPDPIHFHHGVMDTDCNEDIASRHPFANYNAGDFDADAMYQASLPTGEDPPHHQHRKFAAQLPSGTSLERARHASHGGSNADGGAIYSGIANPCDFNNDITYACIDANDDNATTTAAAAAANTTSTATTANHTTSSLLQNKIDGGLVLDFCTCQDYQQYSSCGCSDINKADDDDNASVATTINEPKSSCSGCGRLIRQITYSESYSDETYEHAYSSRLLLRKGRRFSSPDITVSEISNSESQDHVRLRQGSPFGGISRDDMWPRSQSQTCDVRSTFYRPDGDVDSLSAESYPSPEHRVVLDARDHLSDISNTNRAGGGHQLLTHRKSICAFNNNGLDMLSTPDFQKTRGQQHSKRTSLPLNSTLTPMETSEVKSTRSSTLTPLQPKSSAFSGLFSKFSRPKAKTMKSDGDGCIENSPQMKSGNSEEQKLVLPRNAHNSSGNHIPDKNTLKLSKFFQRLSTKEVVSEPQIHEQGHADQDWKAMTGLQVDLENSSQKSTQPETLPERSPPKQYTAIPQRIGLCPDSSSQEMSNSKKKLSTENDTNIDSLCINNNSNNNDNDNIGNVNKNRKFANVNDAPNTNAHSNTTTCAEVTHEKRTATSRPPVSSSENPKHSTEGQVTAAARSSSTPETASNSKTKAGNKTDSGDTCYEYDISTSSESEHTSYDYFLSKVKKSLNLEKEVQHIADMNALRKKLLCKVCKKGAMSDQCDMCGVGGACTHVSSLKCSDWRKFFGELVVDQRAAILDCLTDFAHSPYTIKGDCLPDGNQCRECGGEIMTSDSESLTTVYSLLSQHLRMTSPGAHTPSCDSDEGTMADNSCESADERDACVEEADSSGFDDEDVCEEQHTSSCPPADRRVSSRGKSKKQGKFPKDKRDRKDHAHSQTEYSRKRRSQSSLTQDDALGKGKNLSLYSTADSLTNVHPSPYHKHTSKRNSALGNKHKKNCSCNGSQCHHDQSAQCTLMSTSYSMDDITSTHKSASGKATSGSSSNSKGADGSRTKTSLLATDRAIQDIYAPLPSKALSWLTTRHAALRATNPCACSRVSPSSSVGSLQKAGTETIVAIASNGKEKGISTVEERIHNSTVLPQESSSPPKGINEIPSNPQQQVENSKVDEKQTKTVVTNSLQGKVQTKKIIPDVYSGNDGIKKENITGTTNCVDTAQGSTLEPKLSPGLNLARRRSRQLSLAALDLLPETAFGCDVVEEEACEKDNLNVEPCAQDNSEKTALAHEKPQKPRLVERMTRLFESPNASALATKEPTKSQANISDVTNSTNVTKSQANISDVTNSTNVITNAANVIKSAIEGRISMSVVEAKTGLRKLLGASDNGPDSDEIKTNHANIVLTDKAKTPVSSEKKALTSRKILSQASSGALHPPTPKAQAGLDLLETTEVVTPTPTGTTSVGANLTSLHSANLETPLHQKETKKDYSQSIPGGEKPTGRPRNRSARRENKSRNREFPLRKQAAPPSPSWSSTDSSSSSSSSSSSQLSRRGMYAGGQGGLSQTKQKRLSKKSQLTKKVKSKMSERKKRKKREGGKEEKTYYCFSSDISDIDVVEVENWDAYSSQRSSVSEPRHRGHGNATSHDHHGNGKHGPHGNDKHGNGREHHRHRSSRERSASRGRSRGDRDRNNSVSGDKRKHMTDVTMGSAVDVSGERDAVAIKNVGNDVNDDDQLVQEIYSMPPNSSEVCGVKVKGHRDDVPASPTASPELPKLKTKSKRTDIYKTKKSNNRLLSDLIIRNYDRQVFGNV